VTSSAKILSPIFLPPTLSHKEKGEEGRGHGWMVKSVEISSSIWRRRNGEKEEGGVVRKFSFEKNLLGW